MCLSNNKTFLLVGFAPFRVVSMGLDTVNQVLAQQLKYFLKSIVKFCVNH